MSHYYGFGNIAVDALANPKSKCTGLEASGKFKEKLMLKQRQVEELMIENRIKKLANEEERLRKQIAIANKHTHFAYNVNDRRKSDFMNKEAHQQMMDSHRDMLHRNNDRKREEIKKNIHDHKSFIFVNNTNQGVETKGQTHENNDTIKTFKHKDATNKMQNASNSYSIRNQSLQAQKSDKQSYLESIQRANQQTKADHTMKKEHHEARLNQLAALEEKLIGSLQNTLARKNQAIDGLHQASPALKKTIQPRMAYRYKQSQNSLAGLNQTHSGFDKSNLLRNGDMTQRSSANGSEIVPRTIMSGQEMNEIHVNTETPQI